MRKKIKGLIKKFNAKPQKFRITAIVLTAVVFIGLFCGGCVLFGNPVAKIRIINAANDYIDANMPDMERSRSICKYDITRDVYYINFRPKGWKESFILEFTEDGTITYDGYTIEYVYRNMDQILYG